MISFRRLSVLVLALCLIWPAAAFAKGKGSLVTVNVTMVGPETIVAGEFGEVEVAVENATDRTVTVALDGVIVYADGTRDQLINVTKRTALTIEPGQGFAVILLYIVPADTAPGEATFTATARVTDISGKNKPSGDKRATDSATFEVVEP